ncbi:MAG TPA: tetratricopeptide repeat-containing protein, partial [Pyrinomonadaceae bacterium]|nr:tetratricopeptide repeat-containing protein [Pyrinomonadaceae bacterium]
MQNATDLRKTLTQEAKAILSGSNESPAQIYDLAKRLAALSEFEFARRVLEKAYEKLSGDDAPVLRLRIVQKWALYTYKDTKLNREERFETARKILIKEGAISQTTDQETLGLAGAIYKRRWEVNSQKRDLEWALYYYSKGHQQGPEKDQGYTGINAAFVEDLLAHQEQREAREVGGESETAPERQARARAIRQEIIEHVVPLEAAFDLTKPEDWWWWVYATVGEAYFGLGEYDRAVEWLVDRPRAAGLDISPWMRESTERHLAALAVMQTDAATEAGFVQSPAGVALTKLFGSPYTVGLIYLQREDAVRVGFERRFGLGLSGGGFRASLFHIGVLARLAELDVLRHVEGLSCVSGGS